MMNSSATPIKKTKVEGMINSQIGFLFLVLVGMALVGAVGQFFVEVYHSLL